MNDCVVYYTIQPGDNLTRICAALYPGVYWLRAIEAVAEANDIADPNVIRIGAVLTLPVLTPDPVEEPTEEPYPVDEPVALTDAEWSARWLTFGGRVKSSDYTVPYHRLSANMDRTNETIRASTVKNLFDNADDRFTLAATSDDVDPDDKPAVVVSMPMTFGMQNNTDSAASFLLMAEVGAGEHDDRPDKFDKPGGYVQWFRELADRLAAGRYGTTYIRLAHEHDGAWYPHTSNIDLRTTGADRMIGNTKLTGYTSPDPTVQALVRQAGIDGDRGPLFAHCWRRIVDIARVELGDLFGESVLFDYNLTHSSSVPTTATAGDGPSPFNNPAAWPGDGYVHVIGKDLFCRGSMKSTAALIEALDEHDEFARSKGLPVSFPEVATCEMADPSKGGQGCTDRQGSDWWTTFRARTRLMDVEYATFFARSDDPRTNYRYRPDKVASPLTWATIAELWPA